MPAYSPAFLRSRPWLAGAVVLTPVAGAAAANLALGKVFHITLVANTTITLTNPADGGKYLFIIKQGGAGAFTITFSPVPLLEGGTAIDLTDTVGAIDVVTLVYSATETKYLGAPALAFA